MKKDELKYLEPHVINWTTPATAYPMGSYGRASIRKWPHSKNALFYGEAVKGMLYYKLQKPGNVLTGLKVGKQTWMTDAPPFYWSLESFAERSFGNVLVAGLGLGLVVHCLVKNPNITKITVVEREPDVINLITPLLPKDFRIRIIKADFYRFMNIDTERRDTIIWDLGLWSAGKKPIGLREMWCMPIWTELRYGPAIKLFRHGIDSDPIRKQFIHKHRELMDKVLEQMGQPGE